MNLFELFVKIGVDDQASGKLSVLSEKLGNGIKTAAKVGLTAVTAAATGIAALTKSSVDSYAEYEQLVGGVETLFKDSADSVVKYAESAYKTAGISTNKYMETVTSFSASLLQSTGRVAQQDTAALEIELFEQYKLTKQACEDEYDELEKSWKDRIALAKKNKDENVELLIEQKDQELKALKRLNEDKLAEIEAHNAKVLKEAEEANQMSVTTAESQAKAVELANQAIIDMSDNANKMGTSMEMIQNAYQGFAKQNYSMLDNLKLGYGGTAQEMYRLLNTAAELDEEFAKTANFSIDSKGHLTAEFADITQAIHIIQTEMGITGTTALEAGRTISGSVGSMKSAWQNLLTGLADGNADIEELINNLVTTIIGDGTENNLGVIGNVLPAVERALGGVVQLIAGAAPKIIEILPGLVDQVVPSLITAATDMVNAVIAIVPDLLNTVVTALVHNAPALITAAIGLVQSIVQGIRDNYQILVDGAMIIVEELVGGVVGLLPEIIKLGLDLIVSLANGVAKSLPTLIPTIIDVVLQIVETLTDPKTLQNLLNGAIAIITSIASYLIQPDVINMLLDAAISVVNNLVTFLMENLSPLLNAATDIIMALVDYILDPDNLAKLVETAAYLVVTIAGALIGSAKELDKAVKELGLRIVSKLKTTDWKGLGKNIIDGIKTGISNAWNNLVSWFEGLFDDLIGIAKKILGIASPSKVFKKIGGFTAEGFGVGFEDEFAHVKDDMEDALNFDDASVGINASIRKVGSEAVGGAFGGTSIGNITINVDGAKYSDEQSLAYAIAQEIQNMTDRRVAVYA